MRTINILTVLRADGFPNNEGTFNNPYGGWKYWPKDVFMIVDELDRLVGGQATDRLSIKVAPGDVINWLDTPISQGLRKKDGQDVDMIVYGMKKGYNWNNALEPLEGKTKMMSHAYITTNFDSSKEPTFQCLTYPNNLCTAQVRRDVNEKIEVTYHLKVAKLDLSDPDNIKVLGWYEIDPTIIIDPNLQQEEIENVGAENIHSN
jgi:hypothetical protein